MCYRKGCRCPLCNGWNTADVRTRRARANPEVYDRRGHGKEGTYDFGCRCDLCKTEMRRLRKERQKSVGESKHIVASCGSRARYLQGCRCLPCRTANAAYVACVRHKQQEGRPLLGAKKDGHETAIRLRYLVGEGYSPGVLMSLIGLRRRTFFAHIRTDRQVDESGRVTYAQSPRVTLRVAYKVQRFWRQQQVEGEREA